MTIVLTSSRLIALLAAAFLSAPSPVTSAPLSHVDIVATDYAYRAPATLPAGLTAFQFVNRGTVPHELQLFRFLPSVTTAAARSALTHGRVPDAMADPSGSVLIALPGITAHEQVLIDLRRGERYALVCEFQDEPSKPKHSTMGMVALLEVR